VHDFPELSPWFVEELVSLRPAFPGSGLAAAGSDTISTI